MSNQKKARTHRVNIAVDGGNFNYQNPYIEVKQADTIEWVCSNGFAFAIHIGWDSPLEKGRFHAKKGEKITALVPENAPFGHYRYTVCVSDGENIWTDDPEFIIRR